MVGVLLLGLGGIFPELHPPCGGDFLVELRLSLLAGSGFFLVCLAPFFPHRQDLCLDFALFAIFPSSAGAGVLFLLFFSMAFPYHEPAAAIDLAVGGVPDGEPGPAAEVPYRIWRGRNLLVRQGQAVDPGELALFDAADRF